jgi:hypothetical protein
VGLHVDQREDLVEAGITESSSAWIVSTPAQFITCDEVLWISRQFSSRRSCASICWAHRFGEISVGVSPISTSNASASGMRRVGAHDQCAAPPAAARTAVAAATVVLPTPPCR